jgi:hypothetical protein
LDVPISRIDRRKFFTHPKRFLEVKLDGVVSNYFEWLDAGRYNSGMDMDTMHRVSRQPIDGVFFGFDIDNLFIRIDFNKDLFSQYREKGKLIITFVQPHELQIHTSTFMNKPLSFRIQNKPQNYSGKDFYSISLNKIMELSCPFADLGFSSGMEVDFFIELVKEEEIIQRVPLRTVFYFSVPSIDFERMMWQV